ncbi:Uncharacterised protein [Vibrio cholerae]|nr:Uncharacterised protein [Vibrio cholerae]
MMGAMYSQLMGTSCMWVEVNTSSVLLHLHGFPMSECRLTLLPAHFLSWSIIQIATQRQLDLTLCFA